ncbi:helix-turn-helix domain-containing protein [Phytoactinopolyspora halotolerans]|uniref:Sigma-70 family RNA polymerase sigma factor n=1 Tax=Phytoactinopolyspora halotolerans TaxID=1981512 RepID=A0A6L9S9H6_9ACTN|nr:helix-turn-helix domain-containing protein [Phytoactinopolyspora halotolerans]NEE01212.1 sigma-70 family RNA polymerase sigma factor [Phytoactinopolyspora halotolerans]
MEKPLVDLDRIRAIEDPADRAAAIGEILVEMPRAANELRLMRQQAVLELREAGWSYAQIASKLGLHRNRVQQIAQGFTSKDRRHATDSDL